MEGIGALLVGMLGGGADAVFEQQQQEQQAKMKAAKQILDIALTTGETGPLRLIDPKFMKSMGIGPQELDGIDQMLAPIREERSLKMEGSRADITSKQASARKTSKEADEMDLRSNLIGALPQDKQTMALVPELTKAEALQSEAESSRISAEANKTRAEKDLTFEQRMKLLQAEIAGQIRAASIRASSGRGKDDDDFKEKKLEFDKVKTQFLAADKSLKQARVELNKMAKTKKGGQLIFPDEDSAKMAAEIYNNAIDEYNIAGQTYSQLTGQPVQAQPKLAPKEISGDIFNLYRTKGYTLESPEGVATIDPSTQSQSTQQSGVDPDMEAAKQELQRRKQARGK